MCLDHTHAEMRVGCCQKQDLRDGEDFQDGLVCGWRLLSESGFGGFSGSGQSKGAGWVVRAFDYRATCGIFPPRHVEAQSELAGDLSELVGVVASEGRVDCGPLCCMHEN